MLEFLASPASVPGFAFRALAALAITGAAAYYDAFNKKWVPDYIAYASVAIAIAMNAIFFESALFFQAMAFGAIIFAITYVLYRFGQLGGADVFIMASIASLIPFNPTPLLGPAQTVPYPFFFSLLVPTGVAFILHMMIRFIPYISKKISKNEIEFKPIKVAELIVLVVALSAFSIVISTLPIPLPPAYLALFIFLSIALAFFSFFKQEIKDSMIEYLPKSKLCEEDVIALEKLDAGTIKSLSLSPLMDKKMIERLKKSKLAKIPVYTGMPFFLPYLLIGLIIALLFGDMLHFLS